MKKGIAVTFASDRRPDVGSNAHSNLNHILKWLSLAFFSTGGPRNSQTFYLQIRLFAGISKLYQNSVFAVVWL